MHDPMTVAFEIKSPFKKKTKFSPEGYRETIITIWHHDPEKDGTDDSCGWFIRARHANQEKLEKIRREFLFNYKNNYWFTKDGFRQFSTSGVVLQMYTAALWIHYDRNRGKMNCFLRKHLHSLLCFAENPTDSIGDTITGKFGERITEETMARLAGTIYSDILRKERKWFQHPRWHIHHWKIQFHPWQRMKRKFSNKNRAAC